MQYNEYYDIPIYETGRASGLAQFMIFGKMGDASLRLPKGVGGWAGAFAWGTSSALNVPYSFKSAEALISFGMFQLLRWFYKQVFPNKEFRIHFLPCLKKSAGRFSEIWTCIHGHLMLRGVLLGGLG